MDTIYWIVHDQRALCGRYARRADADRLARELGPGVSVTVQHELQDAHLLARLAHWVDCDKRGRRNGI